MSILPLGSRHVPAGQGQFQRLPAARRLLWCLVKRFRDLVFSLPETRWAVCGEEEEDGGQAGWGVMEAGRDGGWGWPQVL